MSIMLEKGIIWNKNKEKLIARAKELRLQPKYALAKKIRKWRQKQKTLALRRLEFFENKAYKPGIQLKVPTLVPCQLLK